MEVGGAAEPVLVRFRPEAVIALQAHGGRMEHMGLTEEIERAIEGLSNEGGAHDVW